MNILFFNALWRFITMMSAIIQQMNRLLMEQPVVFIILRPW